MPQNNKKTLFQMFDSKFLLQGKRKELVERVSEVLLHDLEKPKILKHFKSRLARLYKSENEQSRKELTQKIEKYLNTLGQDAKEYKNALMEINLASKVSLHQEKMHAVKPANTNRLENKEDLTLEMQIAAKEVRKKGAELGFHHLGEKLSSIAKSVSTIYNTVTEGRAESIPAPQPDDRAGLYYRSISALRTDVSKSFAGFFAAASRLFSCASRSARAQTTVSDLDRESKISEEVHNPILKQARKKKSTKNIIKTEIFYV